MSRNHAILPARRARHPPIRLIANGPSPFPIPSNSRRYLLQLYSDASSAHQLKRTLGRAEY
jgi:hypothetical protein